MLSCCHIFLQGSLQGLDVEERLLRLETDKDSLHIQVSVLSDQIDVQTSKIHDLERVLDDKKNVLESTQDTLSRVLEKPFLLEILHFFCLLVILNFSSSFFFYCFGPVGTPDPFLPRNAKIGIDDRDFKPAPETSRP